MVIKDFVEDKGASVGAAVTMSRAELFLVVGAACLLSAMASHAMFHLLVVGKVITDPQLLVLSGEIKSQIRAVAEVTIQAQNQSGQKLSTVLANQAALGKLIDQKVNDAVNVLAQAHTHVPVPSGPAK